MSKAYKVDRTNGDVPLENDSEVVVYDSIDEAELDLANIEEGQIVGTNDEGINTDAIAENIIASTESAVDEYAANLMQSYGQAVGSLLAMENNGATPAGYLLADGSTFSQTDYPLLYAYLETNVLPIEFNHSILSDPETILNGSALTAITAPYDGIIHISVRTNTSDRYIRVNGQNVAGISSNSLANIDVEVNKGDVVSITGGTAVSSVIVTAAYYKVYKYIKAVSGIETASTEAQEVTNAVNTIEAFVSNAEEYSATEVKTNKTWIDGKSIYRIVLTATAGAGPSAWGWAISQADFNNIGIENITFAGVVADGLQFIPVGVHKSNGFYPMVGMIQSGQRIVLEYTKA